METESLISTIKKLNIPAVLQNNLISNIDNINKEDLTIILEKYGDNVDLIKQADSKILNQYIIGLNNLTEEIDKQNIKNTNNELINSL